MSHKARLWPFVLGPNIVYIKNLNDIFVIWHLSHVRQAIVGIRLQ